MGIKTVQACVFIMAIIALATGIAGCTEDDINDIVREGIEQEVKNQTLGPVESFIQDVQDVVHDLLGGSVNNGGNDGATASPTVDPEATSTPKPIFPATPTPIPLTDADNAIHVTATLDVLVIDKDGNPIPDKMVWFNAVSWTKKDPNWIMLTKPTDKKGKASFTIGYDLIDNRERFARLGSPDYVDYIAMAATTCNPEDPEGKAGSPLYIDVYATDHWKMISYNDASAQAGALKYAAITRSLTLRLIPGNNPGYGPFQYLEYGH